MRKILLHFLLLAIPAITFAQSAKYKLKARVGPEKEVADNTLPVALVVPDERGVIVFKDRGPMLDEKAASKATPKFELYDQNKFGLIRAMDASERLGKQSVELEDMVTFQKGPYLIGTIRHTAQGHFRVLGTPVDPNLTRASVPFEDLVSFNTGINGQHVALGKGSASGGTFRCTTGPGGHLIILGPEVRDTANSRAAHMMASIDQDRRVVWQHVVELEEKLIASEVIDMEADEKGSLWILVRYRYHDGGRKEGPEQEVKLFHVSSNGVAGVRYGLPRNSYVTAANIERAGNGPMIIAGLFTTTETAGEAPRLFRAEMPKGPEDITTATVAATSLPVTRTEVRDVLIARDGSTYVVLEEYDHRPIPHPKTLKPSMKHVRGTLHVMKLGRNGNEAWTTSIRRLIHADDPITGNSFPVLYRDQFSLFMLDNDKQVAQRATPDKPIDPADMRSLRTMHLMFEPDGTYRPKAILENNGSPMAMVGEELFPIGNDRYIAFATSRVEGGGYLPVDIQFSE